jgi:hydrogenase-4 transcriptional activator
LSKEKQKPGNAVVNLEHARARLRSSGGKSTPQSMAEDLENVRELIDQGLTSEARARLTSLLAQARNQPALLAEARCLLSVALEMQGHDRESLEAVVMYEAPEARAKLDHDLILKLRIRISLAYNYTGDHPKAIALLKATLRDVPEVGAEAQAGAVYSSLARVYRSINEYPIARDYSQRALERYRQTGDWRGLAEAYFGVAIAEQQEGHCEAALENYEQTLKLVGEHAATFLLGKIYSNMAGACRDLRRPQEGIRHLEKATSYYERTDHKRSAADGYNNLAINLILIGEWRRAEEALERALALANEVDERGASLPMILDSLGELSMLRGDLHDAKNYLERAVALASEKGNKWYAGQALRTLTRCLLVTNESEEALATAGRALGFAEQIGDHRAIYESHLLLGEAYLQRADLSQCAENLQKVAEQTSESPAHLGLAGEVQRLYGLLATARSDAATAAQHFGRSISIFDLLGDRYRSARAHYELGCAYAMAQLERAPEHFARAINIFRELGARLDLSRVQEAAAALDLTTPQQFRQRDTVLQLLTLRLAEAVASRELLLRELAAVISQETNSRRVVIIEPDEGSRQRVVVAHGCNKDQSAALADEFAILKKDSQFESFAKKHDLAVITLKSSNAPPATLLISPREHAELPGGLSLEPLLRVVELGMDVCALRMRSRTGQGQEEESALAGASLMPGFIHSSPAMTRLVEEVHKIRSSDVTVLVTGESGTGKELVARAIHALSSRRDKIFVPFNCTAVPKELSEGYLFGYRRGAVNGAGQV